MKLVLPINDLNKAISVKYIRRWPKSTGKGWNYLYPEDFLHPFKFLKDVLGIQAKKIESDYEKNNISKDFGVDKKTFAAHALEYLTNRTTWDNFFTKKENRDKYKKPVRQSTLTKDKQFTRMGVKPEASDAKLKELSAQREMIKQEIDSIDKQRDAYIEQARQDIAAEQAAQRHFTVQDRVDYYTAEIAGDLRPFAGVKSGIQQLRELGKTDIEQVISDIKQSGSARIGDDVFTDKDIRDLESYAKKAVKKSLVMANGRFYICG